MALISQLKRPAEKGVRGKRYSTHKGQELLTQTQSIIRSYTCIDRSCMQGWRRVHNELLCVWHSKRPMPCMPQDWTLVLRQNNSSAPWEILLQLRRHRALRASGGLFLAPTVQPLISNDPLLHMPVSDTFSREVELHAMVRLNFGLPGLFTVKEERLDSDLLLCHNMQCLERLTYLATREKNEAGNVRGLDSYRSSQSDVSRLGNRDNRGAVNVSQQRSTQSQGVPGHNAGREPAYWQHDRYDPSRWAPQYSSPVSPVWGRCKQEVSSLQTDFQARLEDSALNRPNHWYCSWQVWTCFYCCSAGQTHKPLNQSQ